MKPKIAIADHAPRVAVLEEIAQSAKAALGEAGQQRRGDRMPSNHGLLDGTVSIIT